ncbi:MAG: hypothetical protein KatS3mg129_1493 [Leptospiraceae bacterium]|nr:MAG: hypothetical protein KatS3mg129_1493 [Leptospiraceae bacterium]
MFLFSFNIKDTMTSKNTPNKNIIERFFVLTIIILSLTFLTILLGPYVRAEDAGLACPDWPLCHGYVIPPLDYQIYLEFIHRVVAGTLGIFFTIWFFWGILKQPIRNRFLPYIILAAFVLTMQIYLGRETITRQLNAYIVKFHLLNAIFFISIIYYIFYQLFRLKFPLKKDNPYISNENVKSLKINLFILLLLLYLQSFLGGRVSANYVGLGLSRISRMLYRNHKK